VVGWIAGENPAAAHRLFGAYTSLLRRLGDFPESGRRYLPDVPSRRAFRFAPLPGFNNYLVFYRLLDDRVEIVRLLHAPVTSRRRCGTT
jgi:plasmid stabilization system protein ParE